MEILALIINPNYFHLIMLLQHRGGRGGYRWMFSIHRAEGENQCRYGWSCGAAFQQCLSQK